MTGFAGGTPGPLTSRSTPPTASGSSLPSVRSTATTSTPRRSSAATAAVPVRPRPTTRARRGSQSSDMASDSPRGDPGLRPGEDERLACEGMEMRDELLGRLLAEVRAPAVAQRELAGGADRRQPGLDRAGVDLPRVFQHFEFDFHSDEAGFVKRRGELL